MATVKTIIDRKHHTLDATDKPMGRLATEVATLLRGKHKATYQPNIDNGDFVTISNVDKIKFTGNKYESKIYYSHSGHPGGLKENSLKKLFEKNPGEVLRKTVWHMLPTNKLRDKMIKRLKVS